MKNDNFPLNELRVKEYIQFHKPFIAEEEIDEVVDTLRSGWLSMGPKTLKFEEEFKNYIGSKYAVSANSWTAAGHLTLEAYQIQRGDEVIVPTMTFPATAEIVCYFGATPVIVDVEPETLNISLEAIERAITPNTRAIIPVHYAGQPCDMDEIIELARKHNLKVIEDAAHSLPAIYKGRKVGTIADVTCFSFYATKTLSTGEGGMICTSDEEVASRTTLMRMHGINRDAWKRYSEAGSWYYEVVAAGYKYNFTDIQASLGLAQLKKVDAMWQQRKELASVYNEGFKDCDFLDIPSIKSDRESAWHLYVIKLKLEQLKINRAQFIDELKKRGVGTGVHFMPVHKHIYYHKTLNIRDHDFPVAEDAFPRLISLPLYPGLTRQQAEIVVEVVCEVAKEFKH